MVILQKNSFTTKKTLLLQKNAFTTKKRFYYKKTLLLQKNSFTTKKRFYYKKTLLLQKNATNMNLIPQKRDCNITVLIFFIFGACFLNGVFSV